MTGMEGREEGRKEGLRVFPLAGRAPFPKTGGAAGWAGGSLTGRICIHCKGMPREMCISLPAFCWVLTLTLNGWDGHGVEMS